MASHPRKFIAQPSEEDLGKFPEAVRHLVKKGREQRYVTHQEIIAAIPNAEEDVDLLDDVYMLFVDLGIEVIDVKDALIWEKKGKGIAMADVIEEIPEIPEVEEDDEPESDESDDASVAEKMDDDDDGDLMHRVATAGIAIDDKETATEEDKKKRKKEREVDLLEVFDVQGIVADIPHSAMSIKGMGRRANSEIRFSEPVGGVVS